MGHVVDGMATAVENADIIVVCISQNYFDSKNCKKELEYADELGKGFIFAKFVSRLLPCSAVPDSPVRTPVCSMNPE